MHDDTTPRTSSRTPCGTPPGPPRAASAGAGAAAAPRLPGHAVGTPVPEPAPALCRGTDGFRGSLSLRSCPDEDSPDGHGTVQGTEEGTGGVGSAQVLTLAGEITCEVLIRYGHPPDAVLAGVRTVETAQVDYLDETGTTLLVRVVAAADQQGRTVRLPSPSRAALDVLWRYGLLDLFDHTTTPPATP